MNMIQEMESDLDRDPREVTMDRIAERLDRICTTDIEYQRAVTVMESLSRGFWDRYGQEDLDELAKMMIRFAHERAAKADLALQRVQKRLKDVESEEETARRIAAVEDSRDFKIAFEKASEGERRVLQDLLPRFVWGKRTEFHIRAKEDSRSHLFNPRPKEWEDLSPGTRAQYKVLEKRLSKKIDLDSASPWEVLRYLGEVARTKSRSTYYRERAVLCKMAENGRLDVWKAIRALPCLETLLEYMNGFKSRRSGERTRARRKKKDPETFSRLLGLLSPRKRDAIEAMMATGARVSEMSSLRLERNGEWISVEIETAKTGSRLLKPGSATREIEFHQGSAEGKRLLEMLQKHGSRPFRDLTADSLRCAWRRARKKLNLAGTQEWCLHALRHAFASKIKAHLSAEMTREYGRGWQKKPEMLKAWRERVAGFLGHSALASTKLYG